MVSARLANVKQTDSMIIRRLSPMSILLGRTSFGEEHPTVEPKDRKILSEEIQNEMDDSNDEPSFYMNRVTTQPTGPKPSNNWNVKQWLRKKLSKVGLFNSFHFLTTLAILVFSSYYLSSSKVPSVVHVTSSDIRIEEILSEVQRMAAHQHSLTADIEELKKAYSKALTELDHSQELSTLRHNVTFIRSEVEDYQSLAVKTEEKILSQIYSLENLLSELTNQLNDLKAKTKRSLEVIPAQNAVAMRKTPVYGVNVANRLLGASIVTQMSSWSVYAGNGLLAETASTVLPSWHADYVLLDREIIEPGKAWCSKDAEPVLTIKLSQPVIPRAVSYQHVAWRSIPPKNAPAVYDVYGCNKTSCETAIVTDCTYHGDDYSTQEQFCEVDSTKVVEKFQTVQFRFKKNQQNTVKTCAYLVRVFGEASESEKPSTEEVTTQNSTIFSYFFGHSLFE